MTNLLSAGGLVLLAILTSSDLQRLETYEGAWGNPDTRQALEERARTEFAGRGVEIANYFLIHNDPRPRNDVYFFVLRAVGDTETALTFIRAVPHPPAHESGFLDRHFGEITVAIEAVLAGDAANDARVVAALEAAIAISRRKPYDTGANEALEVLRLIGNCRSAEASRALVRFSNDSDARFRTVAAEALAHVGPTPGNRAAAETAAPPAAPSASGAVSGQATPTAAVAPPSPATELLRILASDSSPAARAQAATSLGFLDPRDGVAGLRAALMAERDPRVLDAVVASLRRLGSPVDDPAQCRSLMGRTWEGAIAEQMLDCWYRQGATPDQLMEAALQGPATQRAVALSALSMPRSSPLRLVIDPSAQPPSFDPTVRDRLLDAAVWALSQGDDISGSTRILAQEALWNVSGRNMTLALDYGDRITPNRARFDASAALSRADAGAYESIRRKQQAVLGLLIALGFAVLSAFRSPLRRPALLLAASAVGWMLWTFQTHGVRDLPPPPLRLLTVTAIAFFAAGAATAAAALIPARAGTGRIARATQRAATLFFAAILGGAVCGVTRNARLFPSDMEGWELIFDPLGASILAFVAGAILLAIDRGLFRRWVAG
jgi:HEAT repeat protein